MSLLVYFGTPLVIAEVWDQSVIEIIEKQFLRELHLLPRDLSGKIIKNVSQQ
jgi:hypothetical protein